MAGSALDAWRMDTQPRSWMGRKRVSDVPQWRPLSSTNPFAPMLFFQATRRFPILPHTEVIVSRERFPFSRLVRSLARFDSLSPSFERMHVLCERVLWCGFVDLSLFSLFGTLPLCSLRSSRARHELRLTARTDPLADALLRSSRKNPIVQVSTVAIFFRGYCVWLVSTLGSRFCTVLHGARRSGSHFRLTCSSFDRRKTQGRARAHVCVRRSAAFKRLDVQCPPFGIQPYTCAAHAPSVVLSPTCERGAFAIQGRKPMLAEPL